MAWPGGRDVNYQEEFGVESKDALKAKLASIKTLEETNTSLQNTVNAQKDELTGVKSTLASIEAKLGEQGSNNNSNNNNSNNNNVEIPSVSEDEDAAFGARMAPLWQSTLKTNANVNKMNVVNRLRATDPYFNKLEKEFNDMCKTIPITQAGHERGEEIIENAYKIVKAGKMDQILADTRAGKGDFFIESARNSNNGGNGTEERDNKDPNALNDDEKIIAARMGVTPEQFVKTRNAGVNVGRGLKYA